MNRLCLRCGHRNANANGSADEACPACGAIYRKVEAFANENGVLALKKVRSQRPVASTTEKPVPAAKATNEADAATAAPTEKKPWSPLKKVIAGLFTVWVLGTVFVVANNPATNTTSGADNQAAGAMLHCQVAIRRASKNSARAIVPNTMNVFSADADQFAFEWLGGGGLQLQNGFGAMLDSTATCVVAKHDLEIDWLTIDHETVISRPKH